jgi:hypothetical protein
MERESLLARADCAACLGLGRGGCCPSRSRGGRLPKQRHGSAAWRADVVQAIADLTLK